MARGRKNGEHGRKRGNGSGTLMKSGNFYYVLWYSVDENGKRKRHCQSTKTGNLDEAREYLKGMCDEFSIDKALEDREAVAKKVRHTLDDLAYERSEIEDKKPAMELDEGWSWFEKSHSRPRSGASTFRNYQQWYGIFLAWLKANHEDIKELREVTPSVAGEYATYLLGQVRGTTFNRHMNALALVWRHLAADFNDKAKLKANPFAWNRSSGMGIRRVKVTNLERKTHRRRDLHLDEIAKLLEVATGEMKVLVALGFYTGLRLGDCALIKWSDFDRVNGVLDKISLKTDIETTPRVHPALIRIIEDEVKTRSGYLLPEIAELYNGGTTGRVKLTNRIKALFDSVGLETSRVEEGETRAHVVCGFHSLRHAYVTQLKRVGATLSERKALAGHATDEMSAHYTHGNGAPELALPDLSSGVPQETFSTIAAGEIGRGEVAETEREAFDAVCALLGNLEPTTLRAVASEALKLAMENAAKGFKGEAVAAS